MQNAKKISLHDFMAEANSKYYADNIVFGKEGDFYTSPEITPVFGELIGLSFVDMWMKMGSPQDFALVELGPGKGTLMSDILRVGGRYWGQLDLHLVENSKRLKEIQRDTICYDKVTWHNRFEDIQLDKPFLLIANEFFDALPVRQLRKKDGFIQEKYVQDGHESWENCDDEITADCEISPLTDVIFNQITAALSSQKGYALIIDYGYLEGPQSSTIQACKGNKRVSIYETPGKTDLSAYVDFGRLTSSVDATDLYLYGPVTQAAYLTELGLPERIKQITEKTEIPHKHLRAARILVDPTAMGAIFKVMGIASEDFGELPGFTSPFVGQVKKER